jgi:hypothetical protein
MLAGGAASVALASTFEHPLLAVVFGVVVGAAFCMGLRPTVHAYVDNLMTGAALGIPLWGLISVIAIPLLFGQVPAWSAGEMRMRFPALDMDDDVQRIGNICLDGAERYFDAALQDTTGETREALLGRTRMNRG